MGLGKIKYNRLRKKMKSHEATCVKKSLHHDLFHISFNVSKGSEVADND